MRVLFIAFYCVAMKSRTALSRMTTAFFFITTAGELAERFEIDPFACVLMGNHDHLLFRSSRANWCRSMQWFGATCNKKFKLRSNRSHLFQGRLKYMPVQNDACPIQLSYYIRRNPLRAGMVSGFQNRRNSIATC